MQLRGLLVVVFLLTAVSGLEGLRLRRSTAHLHAQDSSSLSARTAATTATATATATATKANEVTGFRLAFFYAPGYCAGLAPAKCHANLKTGGGAVKREAFLHGMWEYPGQNDGWVEAVSVNDGGAAGHAGPTPGDLAPGLRLTDWYRGIPGSGTQGTHALPNAAVVVNNLPRLTERATANFIGIPAAPALNAVARAGAITGARGGWVQTHAANDLLEHEIVKHGFWFQRGVMCKNCPVSWGTAAGYVAAAAGYVVAWKPKLDALIAKLPPAGNYAAGLGGLQNHFNAGAGGAAGLGVNPDFLCPGNGRLQEIHLCFSGFPKGKKEAKLIACNPLVGGNGACHANNMPLD